MGLCREAKEVGVLGRVELHDCMRPLAASPSQSMRILRLIRPFVIALVVAGCASGTAPGGKPAPTASGPSPSAATAPTTGAEVDSPEAAARLVLASDPRFANVQKKDPDLIGQCCYYEAVRGQEGFRVRITVGWGDCPAGCIDHHTWTYDVSRDGDISLIGQAGDPVPPGGVPNG
jgi:hypothetical protein